MPRPAAVLGIVGLAVVVTVMLITVFNGWAVRTPAALGVTVTARGGAPAAPGPAGTGAAGDQEEDQQAQLPPQVKRQRRVETTTAAAGGVNSECCACPSEDARRAVVPPPPPPAPVNRVGFQAVSPRTANLAGGAQAQPTTTASPQVIARQTAPAPPPAPPAPPTTPGFDWKPKIGMIAGYTPDRIEQYQLATNNKQCYSYKHGYTFVLDINTAENSINGWWHKVDVIEKHLPYFDWIMWTDGDTYVTNSTVKLEWFLPHPSEPGSEDIHLVMTDHNVAMNNGVFFLRNCEWSREFIRRWKEIGREVHARPEFNRFFWDDQGGMYELIVQIAYEGAGKPWSRDCMNKDNCCEGGALQRCYNGNLAKLGHPYRNRHVPHIKYIDPVAHQVPLHPKNGWIRGAFDQYRIEEFNGQTWIYGEWTPENFWQRGDFMLHSYTKYTMREMIPQSLAYSCEEMIRQ